MDAVHAAAAAVGSPILRVVTTDANHAAQRFYRRNHFHLVEVRVGAVDQCRLLYEPEIPRDMHGEHVCEREILGRPIPSRWRPTFTHSMR